MVFGGGAVAERDFCGVFGVGWTCCLFSFVWNVFWVEFPLGGVLSLLFLYGVLICFWIDFLSPASALCCSFRMDCLFLD